MTNPIETLRKVLNTHLDCDSTMYAAASNALAEVEAFIHSARSSAWHHRIKHRPYARLMSIEMDAEVLLPQGLDHDPVLKAFVESNREAARYKR